MTDQRCDYEHWRSYDQFLRGECFVPCIPCRSCSRTRATLTNKDKANG